MNQLIIDDGQPGATAANQQKNTQHPTQYRTALCSALDIGYWMLDVLR